MDITTKAIVSVGPVLVLLAVVETVVVDVPLLVVEGEVLVRPGGEGGESSAKAWLDRANQANAHSATRIIIDFDRRIAYRIDYGLY